MFDELPQADKERQLGNIGLVSHAPTTLIFIFEKQAQDCLKRESLVREYLESCCGCVTSRANVGDFYLSLGIENMSSDALDLMMKKLSFEKMKDTLKINTTFVSLKLQ